MRKKIISFALMFLMLITTVFTGVSFSKGEARADSPSVFDTLSFKKIDEDTKEELHGWEFDLTDMNGNLIKKLTEDDSNVDVLYTEGNPDGDIFSAVKEIYCYNVNGDKVTLIDGFKKDGYSYDIGSYEIFKIKETKAPEGYIAKENEETISLIGYAESGAAWGNAITYGFNGMVTDEYDYATGNRILSIGNKKDLTKETIDISGKKTWEDANNQDGKRPDSITVNLLADGVEIDEKQVTDDKWTFENLPKYKDGKEITYTITENKVEGYTSEIDGYNITNSYTPETVTVQGSKTWDDANNQDGKRPNSITVNLLADGVEIDEKQVTNDKWSFDNLPKYKNGKEVVYTITEDEVPGYTTVIDGYNITNSYTPETVRIKGKKVWDDFDNIYNTRPESIVIYLSPTLDTKTITAADNWEYDFGELPKYKDGKEIYYHVLEERDSEELGSNKFLEGNYGPKFWFIYNDISSVWDLGRYDVGNVLRRLKKDIVIKKTDINGKPIQNTKFDIYAHAFVGMEVGLNGFQDLMDFSPYGYAALTNEKYNPFPTGGYGFSNRTVMTSPFMSNFTDKVNHDMSLYPFFDFVYIYTPLLKFKDGTTLLDYLNKNNKAPDYGEYTVNDIDYENTEWYALNLCKLPDFVDISPYDYEGFYYNEIYRHMDYIFFGTPEEDLNEVISDVELNQIRNLYKKLSIGRIELSGNPVNTTLSETMKFKVGEFTTDENGEIKLEDLYYMNRYHLRDGDVLKTHNVTIPTLEIVEKETAHPKYQLDDTVHTINIAEEDEITITNDYTTTDVSFTKIWENDDSNSRPNDITVELYADGEYVKEATVNKSDNYSGTFKDLSKYKNDDLINYTIKEKAVDNYISSVTGNSTNGFTITNSYVKPINVSFKANKTLTGRNLEDGQFTFELKENGKVIDTATNQNGEITFKPIEYTLKDVDKEYTYTINEVNDKKPGYTYDTHTETITVAISDNGDGTLRTNIKTDNDGLVFNNAYAATGTIDLSGKKKLTGRDIKDNEFTFELKENNKIIETVKNTGEKIVFSTINYTLDDIGTHTYTISEKKEHVGGVEYDEHIETVTAEVTDNGDGTLKTEVKTDNDGVVFNNTYSASGKATINGKKILNGKAMDSFTFILKKGEEVVDEATNDSNGNFSFKELSFTLDDVGSHTYTVTEKNDGKGGVDYDTHTETIVVNVSDNGDGTLKVDVKTDNDGVVFNNNYSSSGKINFVGQKNLANKAMETFSFELKEGEDIIETVENAADGKIAFKTITYTLDDVGEHTYTVTEVNDKKPGIAYDTHTETVKVNVTDNGDGTLTATPVYDVDGVVFNNTYSATGKTAISGKKVFNNKAMEDFTFVLKEGDTGIATVKNSETGEFAFPEIEYDLNDVGKHTYTITETNDNKPGVTYDEHVETVTVDVTDNGDGTLKVETTFDEDGVVFTNTYNADGTFIISGIKKLEGKDLADGDFTFILTDQDGNTKETTVKADGTFEFEPFSFTVDDIGKTFTYKVTEKNTETENVTYDEHTEEITISVEDNGDGTLKITPVYDDDGVVFVNKYTEPVIPTEEPVETPTETPMVETPEEIEQREEEEFHETPESTTVVDTGDQSIMPLIIAGILSAAGIVATSVIFKKRKHE